MGYVVVNFEVASSNSFRDIQTNHFVTATADIDDSIRVSLNMAFMAPGCAAVLTLGLARLLLTMNGSKMKQK